MLTEKGSLEERLYTGSDKSVGREGFGIEPEKFDPPSVEDGHEIGKNLCEQNQPRRERKVPC